MSLTSDLYLGAAGLNADSLALQITGNNLNNANTVGYSRQTVNISSGLTVVTLNGPESSGVTASASQARDSFLDQQVQSEKSQTGAATAIQSVYSQVETALGQSINTSGQASGVDSTSSSTPGIAGALNDFFNSIQALTTNPSDSSTKSNVIESASELADQINQADQQLAGVQASTTQQIGSDVQSANQLLSNIANLNAKIAKAEGASTPGSALDLRDQREQDIEQLAGYMNIQVSPDPSGGGQIQVTTQDSSGNQVSLVSASTVVNNIGYDGTGFQAMQSGSPTATLGLSGGSLNAEFQASTGFTQTVRSNLQSLANQLTTAINAAANPSGSGQNIFAAGTNGSLISVDPNLTTNTLQSTATGTSGGNELAVAVANVANQTFSTGNGDQIDGTLGGYYNGVVSDVGQAANTANNNLQDQQLAEQTVESNRDQVSGVSLDEESTNLMQYQQAFQASARFMTTIDTVLDTVINQMGTASGVV